MSDLLDLKNAIQETEGWLDEALEYLAGNDAESATESFETSRDWVSKACTAADRIGGDSAGGEGWKSMETLIERLEALRRSYADAKVDTASLTELKRSFAGLIPGEVQTAIKDEEAYIEDQAERADGQSY